MDNISGKTIAITGAARGIGFATAKALLARGARVVIGDREVALQESAVAKLTNLGQVSGYPLDVTNRESFAGFLDAAEKELGPVDVLVNNAGIMPVGKFSDETDETARLMIDINLHGVIFGTKLALERMVPRRSGHIVNIASQAGKAGLPGGATYCATKHAVVGLSEAVRLENRENGIEVSCVMPAVVNTELGSGLTDTRGVKKLEPEEVADAIVEAIETNRFDVWVPKSSAGIAVVLNLVPRSGREAIAKFMKADKVLAEVDEAKRAGYEERAAHSSAETQESPATEETTA